MNIQVFLFLLWSLLNPICIVTTVYSMSYLGMFDSISGNILTLPQIFFPVFLFIGMIVLLLQFFLLFIISRAFSAQATTVRVFDAFVTAQMPFLSMCLFSPALLPMEGNVIGFLLIPLFLVIVPIAGFITLIKYMIDLDKLIKRETVPGVTFKSIFSAFAVVLVMSLFSLYNFGANTNLGEYFYWKNDTPQFAVSSAMKAIKNKDPDTLAQFVDIDSFLSKENVHKASHKAEIISAVKLGRFLNGDEERLRVNEWVMARQVTGSDSNKYNKGTVGGPVSLSNKNNRLTGTIVFYSEINGDNLNVTFDFQKSDGRYIIVGRESLNELFDRVNLHQKVREAFSDFARELPGQVRTASIKLAGFSAETPKNGSLEDSDWVVREGSSIHTSRHLPVHISAEIQNHTSQRWIQFHAAVVYRDTFTGRVLSIENGAAQIENSPLNPFETRKVILVSNVRPVILLAVADGKAKVAELYPMSVVDDKHKSLKLLEVQIPRL